MRLKHVLRTNTHHSCWTTEWLVALLWLTVHVGIHGRVLGEVGILEKSGNFGESYGRSIAKEWLITDSGQHMSVLWWKCMKMHEWEKLPETMEAIFRAPVMLICAMLKVTFTFSRLPFYVLPSAFHFNPCYSIQFVCYSCIISHWLIDIMSYFIYSFIDEKNYCPWWHLWWHLNDPDCQLFYYF